MSTRVYVAGPYSADNVVDVLKNIGRGEAVAAKLFFLGFNPFCPWHDKDYIIKFPEAEVTVERFYEYCLSWLEVSDCLLVIEGFETSKGTVEEIKFAKRKGIPIYYGVNDLLSTFTV